MGSGVVVVGTGTSEEVGLGSVDWTSLIVSNKDARVLQCTHEGVSDGSDGTALVVVPAPSVLLAVLTSSLFSDVGVSGMDSSALSCLADCVMWSDTSGSLESDGDGVMLASMGEGVSVSPGREGVSV